MTHPFFKNWSNFTKAVFLILLAIFFFDVQGAIIKHMGDRYPVPQLASFRNLFGFIPAILVLVLSREWHDKGRIILIVQWRFGLVRGLFIAGAQYCFYLSLTKMELATASTLTYIGPVFITVLSIPILKHTVGLWRWLAVGTGFFGVLLVMQPGAEVFSPYALLPVAAAFGYALAIVSTKLFVDQVPTPLINMYSAVGALFGSTTLLFATTGYISIESAVDWLWLVAMGAVGGCAVLLMISAYRLTRPGSLSPFEYFGIPFSFILGWVFFGEAPFDRLLPGVIFIVCGGLIIAWREHKKRATPAQAIAK
ncbi:MAG: DMT family transporter [Gammaproteobacteria bacterium]|nr:DMT family transporter [Gammaproteobacteria bacterium]